MVTSLSIKDVAERFSVSAHTLRYYEKAGLLDLVGRNVGGHRRYEERDMEAVNFLLKMRQTGMGIRTLKGYVDAVREGRDTLDFRASMLKSHRQDVEDQIAQLQTCLSIIDKKLD